MARIIVVNRKLKIVMMIAVGLVVSVVMLFYGAQDFVRDDGEPVVKFVEISPVAFYGDTIIISMNSADGELVERVADQIGRPLEMVVEEVGVGRLVPGSDVERFSLMERSKIKFIFEDASRDREGWVYVLAFTNGVSSSKLRRE